MAEKSSDKGKELGIGMIFLFLIVGVFIIWVLTGGPTGSKSVIKIKNTETESTRSSWPRTEDIGTYGTVNN